MTDPLLERRVVELEARLAFQEHALTQLSDALAGSRQESAQLLAAVRRLTEEVRAGRGLLMEDPALEPPPPHY